MQNCNVLLISGQIALVDMPTVTDFKDFEAFKACRAFARDRVAGADSEICAVIFQVQLGAAENMTENLSDADRSSLGPKILAASPQSANEQPQTANGQLQTANCQPHNRQPVTPTQWCLGACWRHHNKPGT